MCLFFEHGAGLNLTPANQAPVLFNSSGERNLFANLGAHRRGELKLGEIPLDGDDASAGTHGTNVEHENFALGELGHLSLTLGTLGTDAEETTEKEKVDLELRVDVGKLADFAQHLTDETIGASERRIARRTDTNQTTGDGVLEQILLGK